MSTITYFERDGERIVIPSGADLKTEMRCDGCGEFLAEPDAVHGRLDTNLIDQPPVAFDAHPAHAAAAIIALGEALGTRHG